MITVLSWNVLSDAYVRPGYFPHTEPALLAPGVRTPRIVARLVALAPDVACLQEAEPALHLVPGHDGSVVEALKASGAMKAGFK